ncbi:MAG TPA: hypothetical protein VFO94_02195 [Gammaproteobacteria bacterium]|nr:hypothetical protein [Gammaproteobacteria bacterium]
MSLFVVTAHEATARWAAQPIELGHGVFQPLVLSPSGVPEVFDETLAQADPELAVLSAMAHGGDADPSKAARIALAAHGATLVPISALLPLPPHPHASDARLRPCSGTAVTPTRRPAAL